MVYRVERILTRMLYCHLSVSTDSYCYKLKKGQRVAGWWLLFLGVVFLSFSISFPLYFCPLDTWESFISSKSPRSFASQGLCIRCSSLCNIYSLLLYSVNSSFRSPYAASWAPAGSAPAVPSTAFNTLELYFMQLTMVYDYASVACFNQFYHFSIEFHNLSVWHIVGRQ